MSKYHAQRHIKGGFDIDESKLDPDANHWARGARGAYNHLVRVVGFETAETMVVDFWNENSTWKDICLNTEKILNDINEEQKNEKSI